MAAHPIFLFLSFFTYILHLHHVTLFPLHQHQQHFYTAKLCCFAATLYTLHTFQTTHTQILPVQTLPLLTSSSTWSHTGLALPGWIFVCLVSSVHRRYRLLTLLVPQSRKSTIPLRLLERLSISPSSPPEPRCSEKPMLTCSTFCNTNSLFLRTRRPGKSAKTFSLRSPTSSNNARRTVFFHETLSKETVEIPQI